MSLTNLGDHCRSDRTYVVHLNSLPSFSEELKPMKKCVLVNALPAAIGRLGVARTCNRQTQGFLKCAAADIRSDP